MNEPEYIECWFIGGPWKDRLVLIARHIVESDAPFRVPDPKKSFIPSVAEWNSGISFSNAMVKIVDYYQQLPLETGVPVYSCLNESAFERGGCRFGLKSVKARKIK